MMTEKDMARCFVRFLKEEEIYNYFKGAHLCIFLPNWYNYFISYDKWFISLRNLTVPIRYNANVDYDFWHWYNFKWLIYIYDNNLDDRIVDVLLDYYKRLSLADDLTSVNVRIMILLKKIILKND